MWLIDLKAKLVETLVLSEFCLRLRFSPEAFNFYGTFLIAKQLMLSILQILEAPAMIFYEAGSNFP